MRVKTRLGCFALFLFLLLLAIGGLAAWQLTQMRAAVNLLAERSVAQLERTNRLAAAFDALRIISYRHVIELDVDRLLQLESSAQLQQRTIAQLLHDYRLQAGSTEQGTLMSFDSHWQRYLQLQEQVRSKSASGEMQQALQLASGAATSSAEAAAHELQQLQELTRSAARRQQQNADAQYRASLRWLATALLLALAGGIAGTLLFAHSLVQPLKQLAQMQHEIAATLDFTRRIGSLRRDEIGQTSQAFDQLLQGLQDNLLQFSAAAQVVNAAVGTLNQAAGDTAQRATLQSDAAHQMAATVEQIAVSIQHIDDRTGDMRQLAQQTHRLAQSGQQLMGATVVDIEATAASVDTVAQQMRELDRAAQHISAVMAVIRAVAEETNLLALNAAIEAARAGEAGRGFAVVADAVRKLAERTAQSTSDIGQTIGAVQAGVDATVSTMCNVVLQVKRGIARVREGGEVVREIQQAAQQTQLLVQEISAAVSEENAASREFARQVEQVSIAADQGRLAAAASANLAQELQQQSLRMLGIVQRYRLG